MLPTRYNDKLSDFYSAMKRLRWSPVRFGHEKASGHPTWRNRLNGKAVYCINPEYIEPVARSRRSGVLDCACSDRTFGVHDKNCSAGNWSPFVDFPTRLYFVTPEPAVAPVPETPGTVFTSPGNVSRAAMLAPPDDSGLLPVVSASYGHLSCIPAVHAFETALARLPRLAASTKRFLIEAAEPLVHAFGYEQSCRISRSGTRARVFEVQPHRAPALGITTNLISMFDNFRETKSSVVGKEYIIQAQQAEIQQLKNENKVKIVSAISNGAVRPRSRGKLANGWRLYCQFEHSAKCTSNWAGRVSRRIGSVAKRARIVVRASHGTDGEGRKWCRAKFQIMKPKPSEIGKKIKKRVFQHARLK